MKCHGIESNSKVEQDVREFRHGLMYVTARCASLSLRVNVELGRVIHNVQEAVTSRPSDTPLTIQHRNCGSTLYAGGMMMVVR